VHVLQRPDQVDTATFYPSWDGKISIRFQADDDGRGFYWLATGGLMAQSGRLGPNGLRPLGAVLHSSQDSCNSTAL